MDSGEIPIEPGDSWFSPKAKQLTGKVGSSLSLPGPKTPKLLGVSTQFGDGFERVSYPEAVKRIKDFLILRTYFLREILLKDF